MNPGMPPRRRRTGSTGPDGRAAASSACTAPDAVWPAFIVSDFRTGQPWAGDPQRPAWSWRGSHDRTRPGTLLGATPRSYPVLITWGAEDRVWDADMAKRLAERMTQAGDPPEAHVFAGEGHWFGAEARNREWELLVDVFGRHLARAVD